jgi:hypothetical protein
MSIQVKPSVATSLVELYMRSKVVPMVLGSPGVGKSQIVCSIADKFGLDLIDIRLSQADPTDLSGFPKVNAQGRADYCPMQHFPLVGDTVPAGKNGWMIFLDELTSAPAAIQAAAYKLILDRRVGTHSLHDKVVMVAAGNRETDNAIVHEMSTALQSRMAHIDMVVDVDEWVAWAHAAGVDHRITDFVKFKPSILYTFTPDHSDHTYACPRTWEFADRTIKTMGGQITGNGQALATAALAGVLSEGVAREFLTFCRVYHTLPTMAQIESDPLNTPVPRDPSSKFAMTGMLANGFTKTNVPAVMAYMSRMDTEFQLLAMRELIARDRSYYTIPEIRTWIANSAAEIF